MQRQGGQQMKNKTGFKKRFDVKKPEGDSVCVSADYRAGGYCILLPGVSRFRCHIGVQTVEQVKTQIARLYGVDFDSITERS
jgi:hypothetical protein